MLERFDSVVGVDFSGAARAGQNIWLARCSIRSQKLRLESLDRLESLAGSAQREIALAKLVEVIRGSGRTLWGIDFPFGLPVELGWKNWHEQLAAVRAFAGGASAFGSECVRIARTLGGKMHIRRTTDSDTATPFDCYHYRIIHQTFHGMRDVLGRLEADAGVCVFPFQFEKLNAPTVVVEACPGSTLKRMKLPHNNYKQPAGGPLESKRRRNRHTILADLREQIEIDEKFERVMMRNPGGDALDAAIAAVGAFADWRRTAIDSVLSHPRYKLEGRVYA